MLYTLDGCGPEIEGDAFIAPTAAVIGSVLLRREASVWWGAVLRGDCDSIAVGRRSNIQDNAVLHVDPGYPVAIGEGVTVGHKAVLHGCTVGGNSLIGIDAVVLNGADIGADCLIGAKYPLIKSIHGLNQCAKQKRGFSSRPKSTACAVDFGGASLPRIREGLVQTFPNALVPEGRRIPPRSLVLGSPGRVARELTDDEVAAIAGFAERYARNARRYRAHLAAVPEAPPCRSAAAGVAP